MCCFCVNSHFYLCSFKRIINNFHYCISCTVYFKIIVRMAKATKWLQAILDYMKKVKSITSTVFGQFS